MSRRTKLTDGRKGKGRGPMSQKRHLAGARVEQAAQQAEAARPLTEEEQLEQDLAGLQDSVHGLGDIWRVTKARRGEDVIFHAVADSDAQLTPANLKALKIPELSVFVPLFEIEIQKDLGAAPTVRVFGRALAKEQLHTVIQEAGQSAGAQDSWADLVEEAGLLDAVLSLLGIVMGTTNLVPCSGIAVDESKFGKRLAADLARREASAHADGVYLASGGLSVVGREEEFPAATVHALTDHEAFEGACRRCVRSAGCHLMAAADDAERGAGVTCGACTLWRDKLGDVVLQAEKSGYASTERLAEAGRYPFSRLPPAAATERLRAMAAQLHAAKKELARERAKVTVRDVSFGDESAVPMPKILLEADRVLREGGVANDPETAAIFAEGSVFRRLWDGSVQTAGVLLKEQAKLDAAAQATGVPATRARGSGNRYDAATIRWALRLYGQGGAGAYASVREAVPGLPSERRLREYRNWTKQEPGINGDLLLELQACLSGVTDPWHRSVVLAFDGMMVKDGLFFDRHNGRLVGIEDVADLVTFTKQTISEPKEGSIPLAKECMQLIATTMDGKLRVPFAHYMMGSGNEALITAMVDASIVALHQIDVFVRIVVCDGASFHRAWQKSVACYVDSSGVWGDDENSKLFTIAMKHPLFPDDPARKIFLMSDPVHLVKKAVSNLFSSGFEDWHTKEMYKGGEYLVWDSVRHAWAEDQKQPAGSWLAPKVTRDHIERSSFTRLKTKFSTQITSGSMQKCLEAYPNRPSAQLVEFCHQFDRYIDLMNSGKPRRSWTGTKAGLRYPIRGTDDARVAELIGIVQWFDDWFDANEALPASTKTLRQMRFITDELYYDLRLAIRGFVGFVAHATGQYSSGPDVAIIPRLFNQDCVEGHFSLLRGSSGARTAITALELPQAQSAALVQNRMGGMERGNVTEHGGGAEGRILQPELKSREQARKEEQKRKNEGRALAQKYGIALY